MDHNYTITLSEAENKAMEFIAADVQEWIDNAVMNRCRIATNEICQTYTNHKLENNEPITATNKPEMVIAAFEEGILLSALDRNNVTPVGFGTTS